MKTNPKMFIGTMASILAMAVFLTIILIPDTPVAVRIIAVVIVITFLAVMGIVYYVFKKRG